MSSSFPLSWWLDRVEGARSVGEGYTALCPAHDDRRNSLSLRELADGSVVVNCFKGCEYHSIVEALQDPEREVQINVVETSKTSKKMSAREWWEVYSQIPSGFWEELGVIFDPEGVTFTWLDSDIQKKRKTGTKEFQWTSDGSPTPPLWPSLPPNLPERIWITEGESDCGILRYIGFEAFAVTKGVRSFPKLLEASSSVLGDRGVDQVVLVVDADDSGNETLTTLASALAGSPLEFLTVDLSKLLDPLRGEKDIRDLWRRVKSSDRMREALEARLRVLKAPSTKQWISVGELLEKNLTEQPWLVHRTIFRNSVGMIVGHPKMGKSWLALDLGLSVATGTPFLGAFEVQNPGPVVYISKEDPEHSLQDRLAKILIAKGIGGSFSRHGKKLHVQLPKKVEVPLMTDLSRSFTFTSGEIDRLLEDLTRFKKRYGYLSLLIFDPILRMLVDADEFKASDINRSIFEPVSMISRELDTACILVHHRSKGLGSVKGSYGSMAFHAFSDSTLYLQGNEIPEDGWVRVRNEFKSAQEFSWGYRFQDLDKQYIVEADITEKKGDSVGTQIVREIQEGSGISVSEIQKMHPDIPMSQLREVLRALESRGLIYRQKEDREGRGRRVDLWFATPDDPEEFLEETEA